MVKKIVLIVSIISVFSCIFLFVIWRNYFGPKPILRFCDQCADNDSECIKNDVVRANQIDAALDAGIEFKIVRGKPCEGFDKYQDDNITIHEVFYKNQ